MFGLNKEDFIYLGIEAFEDCKPNISVEELESLRVLCLD